MVGLLDVQLVMCSFSSPNSFFGNWSKNFSQDGGRADALLKQGAVFVIYDLDDEEVLCSLLLPIVTESGEYLLDSRIQDLSRRFARFAIVLPGWKGSETLVIPKLNVDQRAVPPIRLALWPLE